MDTRLQEAGQTRLENPTQAKTQTPSGPAASKGLAPPGPAGVPLQVSPGSAGVSWSAPPWEKAAAEFQCVGLKLLIPNPSEGGHRDSMSVGFSWALGELLQLSRVSNISLPTWCRDSHSPSHKPQPQRLTKPLSPPHEPQCLSQAEQRQGCCRGHLLPQPCATLPGTAPPSLPSCCCLTVPVSQHQGPRPPMQGLFLRTLCGLPVSPAVFSGTFSNAPEVQNRVQLLRHHLHLDSDICWPRGLDVCPRACSVLSNSRDPTDRSPPNSSVHGIL